MPLLSLRPSPPTWGLGRLAWLCLALALAPTSVPAQGMLGKLLKMATEPNVRQKSADKPAQGAKSKVPITGAFGFRLGEVGKPGRPALEHEDAIGYQFTPKEPLPGFTSYVVALTPLTHRIGYIIAEAAPSDATLGERTLASLIAKHGPTPAQKDEEGTTYVWTDGKKELGFFVGDGFLRLLYNDHTYDEAGLAEMKKRQASPPAAPPLKGPLHLRALTGAQAFGVEMGAPQTIPQGAEREPGHVSFDFAARDPIPGFSRHTVYVHPTDGRAFQVSAQSTALNAAEVEQLIADLEARFGPSSLETTEKGVASRFWVFPNERFIHLQRYPDQIVLLLLDEKIRMAASATASK